MRLVGTDGTHQVMPLAEALRAARNAKLDLVQVAGIACCCQMLVTLIPTVYGALLKSAVSGTDHWIHAVKEMLVIALPVPS